MNTIETSIEFDKIKKIWMDYALTDAAKRAVRDAAPILSEIELRLRQNETTQARLMLEKGGNPPLVSMSGIRVLLAAAKRGECLSAAQLEELEGALTAVQRLKRYLDRCKQYQVSLAYEEERLNPVEELREQIRLQIRGGEVDRNASRLLRSLRDEIDQTETKMREKADAVIRANKECMSDSYSTMRSGHICVPVKKAYKFRISGSVLEKSASGNTLFIEPAASAKLYEELQLLRIDEENEVRRILYTLTALVSDQADFMEENQRVMEKLDLIFSRGKLSMEYNGVEPAINTDRTIRLKDGRHPLMDPKTCVPLQFRIGGDIRGIVITGPNTGGKTVALKTVALACMMAQCGLHVACSEADICMNSNFLCDIGDGQNLSENLSTFSAHITNVMDILRKANRESLVILDELGSGTDPTEGMGIAIAILEELKKSQALFLVTTHYPEVKQYAQQEDGICNARMTFDKESLRPLYQLVIGEAGESCAFYIAGKLGMPASMLRRAQIAAYGAAALEEPVQNGAVEDELVHEKVQKIRKQKQERAEAGTRQKRAMSFHLGDSVMVYPEKKIGIVCRTADERGILQIQLPGKKIYISHKRIRLHVAAEKLYPENYDFSIIFDTVENRKLRHKMERKYVEGATLVTEEPCSSDILTGGDN